MTADSDTPRPIFIIGSYRSGTSVLTWCLGQHSNIWLLPETNWIGDYALSLPHWYEMGAGRERSHFVMSKMSEQDVYASFAKAVDDIVKRSCRHRTRNIHFEPEDNLQHAKVKLRAGDPKNRWVDGTPEYSHYVGALLRLFPQAKFIHMLRNPHDVVRSLMHFDRVSSWKTDARDGYKTWHRLTESAFAAEQSFGSRTVRRFLHRDLVDRPAEFLSDMLQFLGEDYEPECLLPLNNKMNSSGVDDVELGDKIRQSRRGRNAQAYFEELTGNLDVELMPDPAAAAEFSRREQKLLAKSRIA